MQGQYLRRARLSRPWQQILLRSLAVMEIEGIQTLGSEEQSPPPWAPFGLIPVRCEVDLSNAELTGVLFVILLFLATAQLLGSIFVKMRQPKVVGEILAGVVLGPGVLGRIPVVARLVTT